MLGCYSLPVALSGKFFDRGFDWTGPSFKNIDSSLEALHTLPFSKNDSMSNSDKLILIGHNSGGFGALWFASHYPDRVLAVIPAAAFINMQLYLPTFMNMGNSYSDPILNAVNQINSIWNQVLPKIASIYMHPIWQIYQS